MHTSCPVKHPGNTGFGNIRWNYDVVLTYEIMKTKICTKCVHYNRIWCRYRDTFTIDPIDGEVLWACKEKARDSRANNKKGRCGPEGRWYKAIPFYYDDRLLIPATIVSVVVLIWGLAYLLAAGMA